MTTKLKPHDAFDICLEVYKAAREIVDERQPTMRLESTSKFLWRPDLHPRLVEYVSDFALAGQRALAPRESKPRRLTAAARTSKLLANFRLKPPRASRLILFRMHYLGGAEYETVRHFLGVSEVNCADWVDEIKELVGRELLRACIFPPGRYFREITTAMAKRKTKRDSSTASLAIPSGWEE